MILAWGGATIPGGSRAIDKGRWESRITLGGRAGNGIGADDIDVALRFLSLFLNITCNVKAYRLPGTEGFCESSKWDVHIKERHTFRHK
jgi:hypothetical protein